MGESMLDQPEGMSSASRCYLAWVSRKLQQRAPQPLAAVVGRLEAGVVPDLGGETFAQGAASVCTKTELLAAPRIPLNLLTPADESTTERASRAKAIPGRNGKELVSLPC